MKYLQSFFENELCPEKRVSEEKYGQFLESFQRSLNFNPASLLGGCASQSELMLLYRALDYRCDKEENMTAAEAAKDLGVSAPSISRTLKSLAEKGYVERISDENDRRSVRISVTSDGEALINSFFIKVFSVLDTAMSGFSTAETESMIDLYGRIINAIASAIRSDTSERSQ